jgi:hypothetical protein
MIPAKQKRKTHLKIHPPTPLLKLIDSLHSVLSFRLPSAFDIHTRGVVFAENIV